MGWEVDETEIRKPEKKWERERCKNEDSISFQVSFIKSPKDQQGFWENHNSSDFSQDPEIPGEDLSGFSPMPATKH